MECKGCIPSLREKHCVAKPETMHSEYSSSKKTRFFFMICSFCTFFRLSREMVMHNFKNSVSASRRVINTAPPYIEDVLEKYADLSGLTSLALGSSFWNPPINAITDLQNDILSRSNHRYGNILGYQPLKNSISNLLTKQGISMADMEVTVTAGANQGFLNLATLLCDATDDVVVVAPYYFSHLMSLQLCQAKVHICPFNPATLEPDFNALTSLMKKYSPKMVVITSPNNPSGLVWSRDNIYQMVDICRTYSSWLAVDQTYHEFLFDDAKHVYPCGKRFNYEKILHIFSFSKIFGLAGWRVGYVVYPATLSEHMRKIQDASVTHATILSQKLAHLCISQTYDDSSMVLKNSWFESHRQLLHQVREILWPIVAKMGTVKTYGAFYFLIPVPSKISEKEAVDILAKQFGVLLMHGAPFGCPGHMRLSYGSIPPDEILSAIEKLKAGFEYLRLLSDERENLV